MLSAKILFFVCLAFIILTNGIIRANGEEISCDSTCARMRQIFVQENIVRVMALGKGIINGSGVLLKEGILTNNHVIEGALKIYVEFYKINRFYEVAVIGRDPAADLALLTAPVLPRGIEPIVLGDTLQVGDQVFTMGYPLGIRSVTVGNVNATESISWLYAITQAPLAPGNSGGPLINKQGNMSGVNTAIVSAPGVLISLVLSAEYVKLILPRLTRERIVRHGAVGFAYYDAAQILPVLIERMGLSYPPYDGVMVIGVPPSSPPDRAGVRSGDYVVKFNGIAVENTRDLEKRVFFDYRPDEEIEIELKRGNQVLKKRFLLSEYISPFQRQNNQD